MTQQKQRPIGIIGAMAQEVELLIDKMQNPKKTHLAGMLFVSGQLCGNAVIIMQSGIGKVNAAIGTTLLIERFHAAAVINTGVAGGLGEQLNIGDIVIGERIAHHDVDVSAFGHEIGKIPEMPKEYHSTPAFVQAMQEVGNRFFSLNVHIGQIVSGDCFVHEQSHFQTIQQHFPNVLAVEMESAAIAQTCYRFNLPFVIIRAISDLADQEATTSFETFVTTASKRSADIVTALLEAISPR